MKVAFLLHRSSGLLKKAKRGDFPKLFYSFLQFKELYDDEDMSVQSLDAFPNFGRYVPRSVWRKVLSVRLKKYDVVFATTDGATQLLSEMRTQLLLSERNVLVGTVQSFFDDGRDTSQLEQMDGIVTFTATNIAHLKEKCPRVPRFLVHLGTDTEFYRPAPYEPTGGIISVGMDKNRDWKKVVRLAEKMPETLFTIIANDQLTMFEGENIRFLGDTDHVRTREEIERSAAAFIPTLKNSYFSGQTTLLNITSIGRPCVMERTNCFEGYGLSPEYFFEPADSDEQVIEKLRQAMDMNGPVRDALARNQEHVRKELSNYGMARELHKVFSGLIASRTSESAAFNQ